MTKPQLIDLPKICDPRGNLSFIESERHVPFEVKRCYWIYDVPGGMFRGGHAFINQDEFIVAMSGSFDVVLNDGTGEQRYHMARSYYGIYASLGNTSDSCVESGAVASACENTDSSFHC